MRLTKYNVVKLLNANGWMSRDEIEKACGIKDRFQSVLSDFIFIECELRNEGRLKETKKMNGVCATDEMLYSLKKRK